MLGALDDGELRRGDASELSGAFQRDARARGLEGVIVDDGAQVLQHRLVARGRELVDRDGMLAAEQANDVGEEWKGS
jgi:hypothetical protein